VKVGIKPKLSEWVFLKERCRAGSSSRSDRKTRSEKETLAHFVGTMARG